VPYALAAAWLGPGSTSNPKLNCGIDIAWAQGVDQVATTEVNFGEVG
jgi:hypothetical protein